MKVDIESGATDRFDVYAQPSPAPTGHPIVAQGKGGTTAALGWTVFQKTEALKGRTKAVIAAFPAARLDRPFRALDFGGPKSRGDALLCPGLK